MNFLDRHFGRLGNRMFQIAALYAYSKDLDVDYYFQDPKWFEKYKQDIKILFGESIGYEDKIAIHFRRGDYITTHKDFYVDLNKTDYYKKAMAEFPNEKFLLFSDDNKWLVENWPGYEYATGDEETDLKRFASCKGHIIANSSWSWWGAYLGKGKVIAPKAWFIDGVERTVCPKEWLRL